MGATFCEAYFHMETERTWQLEVFELNFFLNRFYIHVFGL